MSNNATSCRTTLRAVWLLALRAVPRARCAPEHTPPRPPPSYGPKRL